LRVGVAAVFLGLVASAHAAFEIKTTEVDWDQVEAKKSFTVFMEREELSALDRVSRMVFAVQLGAGGGKTEGLTVRWQVAQGATPVARSTASLAKGLADVTFSLAGLKPGRYDVSAELLRGDKALDQGKTFFRVVEAKPPASKGRIALHLPRGVPLKDGTYPVSTGVGFPKGALWGEATLRVVKADGTPVPCQATVRSRWGCVPETSIRWLGLDFQAEPAPAWWPERKDTRYYLEFGPDVKPASAPVNIQTRETPEGIEVDAGALRFLVRRQGFNLIDNVRLNGKETLTAGAKDGAYLIDHEGAVYRAANDGRTELRIEEQGDLRVTLRAEGWYVKDGTAGEKLSYTLPTDKLCKFITRIEAYAGRPWVRVQHTWVLTYDSYTVRLRDVGLALSAPGCARAEFGVEGGAPVEATVGAKGLYLLQHTPEEFVLEAGDGAALAKGKRSAGWALAAGRNGLLAVGHRETWQRFPKEFEVLPDAVRLHLWPAHGREHPEIDPYKHEQINRLWFAHQGKELNLAMPWQYYFATAQITGNASTGIYSPGGMPMGGIHTSAMGMAITSDIQLLFAAPEQAAQARDMAACWQTAPHALPDPKWTCASLAAGYMQPYSPEAMKAAEATIEDVVKGYWETQDTCGEYGMWLYRPWHHTTQCEPGKLTLYRLYNATHHYESIMPWMLYARSGDPFYLMQGTANMRELTDVQVQHYNDPAYPHREFWARQGRLVGSTKHTNGFCPWGGDHAVLAHLTCYAGMMLAHYVTGDLRWREVVVDEWQKTILTGRKDPEFAKADRTDALSPGGVLANEKEGARDVTNPLGEMIDLYQLTYDPRVLALMAPMLDYYLNKYMRPWGMPVHNVELFYGSEQARRQVLDAVKERRDLKSKAADTRHFWYTHAQHDNFAMASIIDPASNAHIDAWLTADVTAKRNWAAAARKQTPMAVTFCTVPDYVLYLPRVMYAVAQAGGEVSLSRLAASQPMLIGDTATGGWLRCIVKKEKAGPLPVALYGSVAKDGVKIRAFGPDNKPLSETTVPEGTHSPFEMTLPDAGPGEYVLFIRARDAKDELFVPLTALPEVYVTGYWSQHTECRYFTRSPGDAPVRHTLQPHKARASVMTDDQQLLASTGNGDPMSFEVGPKGAWVIGQTRYAHATPALVLSCGPDRWFAPSAAKMALKP
jgi:hypothetical protein